MKVRVVDKHMRPQPMALSLLLFPGPRSPRNSGQLALRHSAQPPVPEHPWNLPPTASALSSPRGSACTYLHRCLHPLRGGFDLCYSQWESGWVGPHLAGLCNHCYQNAARIAPLQESKGIRGSVLGPRRVYSRHWEKQGAYSHAGRPWCHPRRGSGSRLSLLHHGLPWC